MLKIEDPEDEIETRGSAYKFTLLNSLEMSHLGKMRISPNWENQFCSNLRCWKEDMRGYLRGKFQTQRSSNFGDITETMSGILQKKP